MMKVYVKWDYTDEYGSPFNGMDGIINWFETIEGAEAFIADMRKGNGSYFKLWKVAEGDYATYLRIAELRAELAELEKLF